MKKSILRDLGIAYGFVLLGFSANSALAQGGASGLVYVPGPFECSQACTSDLMCASWNFIPMNNGTYQSMGQCKLSNSPNVAQIPGSVSGLPQRSTPQNQVYYSNQSILSAPAQVMNNYGQGQIPDWKPMPNNNAGSPYEGNYSIKPLNTPMQKAPVMVQNPPSMPMAAPVMNAPAAPSVVYSQKPPVAPVSPAPQMVQVAKPMPPQQPMAYQPPAPVYQPPAPVYQPPAPVYQAPPLAPLKPPIMDANKPVLEAETSNGPLRAGAKSIFASKTDAQPSQADLMNAQGAAYTPSQSYQNYKTAGSSQYSVQSEWNNVADAVANGKNTTNIDWSKTKPIMSNDISAKPKEEKAKKSWLQNLFNKKEEAPTEMPIESGIGPLRKN